jgi:hypothetical protein
MPPRAMFQGDTTHLRASERPVRAGVHTDTIVINPPMQQVATRANYLNSVGSNPPRTAKDGTPKSMCRKRENVKRYKPASFEQGCLAPPHFM